MTFQADKARGMAVEVLVMEYFTGRGWKAERIRAERQRKGAGDIRLECPRTLLVGELEVKADFGNGPNCLLELATDGGQELARASGVLGTRADQILFVRCATWTCYLFRVREIEELMPQWMAAWVPFRLRDQGARTSRQVLPVPWTELARAGRTITLRPLEGIR